MLTYSKKSFICTSYAHNYWVDRKQHYAIFCVSQNVLFDPRGRVNKIKVVKMTRLQGDKVMRIILSNIITRITTAISSKAPK